MRKRRTRRTPRAVPEGLLRLAVSVEEAATMAGVSPSTIREWAHSGKLRVIKKGRGKNRFHFTVPIRSIEELLSSFNGPNMRSL
jgi:excisionase family DNA binding protein